MPTALIVSGLAGSRHASCISRHELGIDLRNAELTAAMESDEPKRHRPLEQASSAWRSPTCTRLDELAARHGWTTNAGSLRVSPAPARARTLARYGITMDERARQRRETLIDPSRRRELIRQADDLATGFKAEFKNEDKLKELSRQAQHNYVLTAMISSTQ